MFCLQRLDQMVPEVPPNLGFCDSSLAQGYAGQSWAQRLLPEHEPSPLAHSGMSFAKKLHYPYCHLLANARQGIGEITAARQDRYPQEMGRPWAAPWGQGFKEMSANAQQHA